MTDRTKLSFTFTILIFIFVSAISTLIITAMASTEIFASTADPIQSKFVYGCVKSGVNLLCEPTPNKFDSFALIGHTELIQSKANPTNYDSVEGVFGNALEISGYRLKHLTVPDQVEINPPIFSVSFWMKQDPRYLANSSVISHVNLEVRIKPFSISTVLFQNCIIAVLNFGT